MNSSSLGLGLRVEGLRTLGISVVAAVVVLGFYHFPSATTLKSVGADCRPAAYALKKQGSVCKVQLDVHGVRPPATTALPPNQGTNRDLSPICVDVCLDVCMDVWM